MSGTTTDPEQLKRLAAEQAFAFLRPGMVIGLGTGSTANHFIDVVGEQVGHGFDVVCVPTSERTRERAAKLGIRLSTLDEHPALDLTVDGADEVDAELRLIKGGGGALLREKIVASASAGLVVIADRSKLVGTLGRFPLPIEVVAFGLSATRRHIFQAASACGCEGEIRLRTAGDRPYLSDGGNHILDCHFGLIPYPEKLAARLDGVVGVVEHGLFIGMTAVCVVAGAAGVDILGDAARLARQR